MFDKFGYIADCSEFNELAENLLNEGDTESLKVLAEENGIDEMFVQMYMEGETMQLTDTMTFAMGKLEMESKELKPQELMVDWIEYVKSLVMGSEIMACAVRKEDKTLAGLIAYLLQWSFKHQVEISAEIKKAAGVNAGKVTMGIPGMGTAKKLIREYYGG